MLSGRQQKPWEAQNKPTMHGDALPPKGHVQGYMSGVASQSLHHTQRLTQNALKSNKAKS